MKIAERSDILKFLDPLNKFEELQKFVEAKGDYNPQFTYSTDHINILDEVSQYVHRLKEKTAKLRTNNGIKQLMLEKCDEILCKFTLLQAYHNQDYDAILRFNTQLFGEMQNYSAQKNIDYSILERYFGLSYYILFEGTNIAPCEILNQKQVKLLLLFHTQAIGFNSCGIQFANFGNTNMQVRIGPKPIIYIHKKETYKAFDVCVSILHEVYGHLLRYKNGITSGYHILQGGTSNYLTIEEGIAVFQASRIEGVKKAWDRLLSSYKYLPEASNLNRVQLTEYYKSKGRTDLESIFWSLLRIKRGIQDTSVIHPGTIFYKDKVYIDGYHEVLSYFSNQIEKINQVKSKDGNKNKKNSLPMNDIIMIGRIKISDIEKISCILSASQL